MKTGQAGSNGTQDYIAQLSHSDDNVRSQAWKEWVESGEGWKLTKRVRCIAHYYKLDDGHADSIFWETIWSLMNKCVDGEFHPEKASLATLGSTIARNIAWKIDRDLKRADAWPVTGDNEHDDEDDKDIRDPNSPDLELQAEFQADYQNKIERIKAGARIKPRDWNIFELRHKDGFNVDEVSAITGESSENVKTITSRVKSRITEWLAHQPEW